MSNKKSYMDRENILSEVMKNKTDEYIKNHLDSSGEKPAYEPKIELVNKEWKKGDDGKLINCSGMIRNSNKKVSVSYNKNTLDLVEFKIGERKLPLVIFRKPHLKKSNYEINIK